MIYLRCMRWLNEGYKIDILNFNWQNVNDAISMIGRHERAMLTDAIRIDVYTNLPSGGQFEKKIRLTEMKNKIA